MKKMEEMKKLYETGYALVEDYGWEEATYSIEDDDEWEDINHWDETDEEVQKIVVDHEQREIRVYLEDED